MAVIVMMREGLVAVRRRLIIVPIDMDRELDTRNLPTRQIGSVGHAGNARERQHQERKKGKKLPHDGWPLSQEYWCVIA